jgi:hypothetical protein
MAAPAAPGCKANMGEPWGTNKTGRCVVMGVRGQWFERTTVSAEGFALSKDWTLWPLFD